MQETDFDDLKNAYIEDIKASNMTNADYYARVMLVTLKICLQAGFEEEMFETTPKMILTMVIMISGWIYSTYVLVLITNVMMAAESSEMKYEIITEEVAAFCQSMNLSPELTKRLQSFYRHKFQENYFNEKEINLTISKNLRKEITMHSCAHLIAKVQLFKDLPENVIEGIIECLTREIFFENDVIIKEGTVGDAMYFIAYGAAGIFNMTGKLLAKLSDGSHFGEIALVTKGNRRNATVKALEICDVYVLSQKDFRNVIEPFPEVRQKLEHIALKRMKK
jgi:hyperpolarization activated cyclic nucleotide-gated potassium channel 2